MSFALEKRRLLALLAWATPLPLPWNDLLPWPVFALWLLLVGGFLRRLERARRAGPPDEGPRAWPAWVANLLGALYLPLLVVDLRFLSGGRVVGPLVHLILFALVVKLHRVETDRDRWQVFAGVFVVFLAAMGTSVHPTIALYLVAWLALAIHVLARFAYLAVLTDLGHRDRAPAPLPLGRFVAALTALSVLAAIPLFVILPRSRVPFLVGRGSPASANVVSVAEFSDRLTLDSIGRVRGNRGIALRATFDPPLEAADEARFKAGVFDRFDGRSWSKPEAAAGRFERATEDGVAVVPGARPLDPRLARSATVWLQSIDSNALPVPVETLRLQAGIFPGLEIDAGGVPRVAGRRPDTLVYQAGMAAAPVSGAALPGDQATALLAADGGLLSAAMRELAARAVAGAATPGQKVARLERFLYENYDYTLEFAASPAANPIEDFLFRTRRGNCELFASALVLLLRAEGIPARLVTGFLGGEENPLEGYLVVRQENAHAWVEAWVDPSTATGAGPVGWVLADPTPAEGRPVARPDAGLGRLASQVWDFVVFRWDRYVLTFDAADQQGFALRAIDRLWAWWRAVRRGRGGTAPAAIEAPAPAFEAGDPPVPAAPDGVWPGTPIALGAALAIAVLGAEILRRRAARAAANPVLAYRRLRSTLAREMRPRRAALGPLGLVELLRRHAPGAAEPGRRIVEAYLERSFSGAAATMPPGSRSWRADLDAVRRALRQAEAGSGRGAEPRGR